MTKSAKQLAIEDFLSYRLSVVSRLINRRSTRYFNEQFDLTLAEWRALAQIAAGTNKTAKSIAEHTYADKGQVSRAVAGLQKKGLVRSKPNPADKRSVELYLTKKGTAIHAKIMPMRAEENELIAAILSAKEFDAINEMLRRIQSHLITMD